ncbi:MAG: SusC/RagA family TonB-linked outer membrane protein [Bacteroidales bacterium]|nr:SusC/RagA family TonB-linked outer membrane protein [Bacteroidales bacterium]
MNSKLILLAFNIFLIFNTIDATPNCILNIKNSELYTFTFSFPDDTITSNTDTITKDNSFETQYGLLELNCIAGVVDKINAESFIQGSINSPEQLIKGLVAGFLISDYDGSPGSSSLYSLRGGSSFSNNNPPLVIIDGFPIDLSEYSTTQNPLSVIHSNDIESITVLKDGTALNYGAKASNGVIIITTKKAYVNSPFRVSYSGNVSLSANQKTHDVYSANEYRTLINEQYSDNPEAISLLGNSDTDWQNEIFQKSISTNHHINLSGYFNKINTPYSVSYGYQKQNGILKASSLQRNNLALKLQPSFFKDHLRFNLDIKNSFNKGQTADTMAITNAILFDPTQAVYDEGNDFYGYFTWQVSSGDMNHIATRNPLAILELNNDRIKEKHAMYNFAMNYQFHFIPDLNISIRYGHHNILSDRTIILPANSPYNYFYENESKEEYIDSVSSNIIDSYLSYNKEFKAINSKMNILLSNFNQSSSKKNSYSKSELNSITESSSSSITHIQSSFAGRLNFCFNDRYFVNLSIRREALSKYSKEFENYPYIGIAWKIVKENFFKKNIFLNDLKLFINYGISSQQTNSDEIYYLYNSFSNPLYDPLTRFNNFDIKTPVQSDFNFGLNYGFYKNRFKGYLNYYMRNSKDIIVPASFSFATGYSIINISLGEIKNKGVEISLNSILLSKQNFNWSAGLRFAYNKNEINYLLKDTVLTCLISGGIYGGVGNSIQVQMPDYPVNSFFVLGQVYGADKLPVEGLYIDMNEDGVFDYDDFYANKKPSPDYTMSFNSSLKYKKFDLSVIGRVYFGNYVYNNAASYTSSYSSLYSQSGYLSNITKGYNFEEAQYFSDYYIEDASFIKIDNINIGYSLNKNKKLNARLYITVHNAFTFTKYSGIDPEIPSGIDGFRYPVPRIFSIGLDVNF